MRIYYRTYTFCYAANYIVYGSFGDELDLIVNSWTFNGILNDDLTYSAAPVWFISSTGYPLYSQRWKFTLQNEANTHYRFSYTANMKDGSSAEYIVELYMKASCEVTLGCTGDDVTYLAWFTREGGRQYFPFTGKKSFTVTIPDADTYMTTDLVKVNSNRKDVYSGEILSTGNIPEVSLDLLQSLKEAIQVYYVENIFNDGFQHYTPVILQDGDFTKKKTGEKRWDVKLKFIYAAERQIQSQ